jgi:hypothetical protein
LKKIRILTLLMLAGLLVMACSLPEFIVESIDQSLAGEAPALTEAVASPGEAGFTPLAPTVLPQLPPEVCLAGTWEISDINEYVLAAIPPEMAEQYELAYTGTSGSAYFILSPDGQVRLQAVDLEMLFEAKAAIFTVPVTVRLDGEAVGRYTAEGSDATHGTLTTSEMDTSNLTASAQAMGQDLLTQAQILRAIPLLQPPANKAQYVCTDNTLQLKVSSYPEDVPPLVFTRK